MVNASSCTFELVCWRHQRAQWEYEARSCYWISLGEYSSYVINPVDTDTEGAITSVRINRVSVLSGLNVGKMYGSFRRDKANCP